MGRRVARLRGARPLHDLDCGGSLSDLDPGPKEGFLRYIKREPLGVVFTIAPWNYPYLTAVNSVIPALMAGNTVVLKHAAQTLLVAERFQKAFDKAKLPKGVFQHLVLDPQADGRDHLRRPCQHGLLHRLGCGRQGDGAGGGRPVHQCRARAWRQGSGLCAPRCQSGACGREPCRWRLLQFRARAAAASSASMCTRKCGTNSSTASSI